MANKNNIGEDDKIFKVKNDGTIVRVDETNSTMSRPKKTGKKVFWIIISVLLIVGLAIGGYAYYEETKWVKYNTDGYVRELEDKVFQYTSCDYVYWTTQGTNGFLHLFRDCSQFHNMQNNEGSVRSGFRYFYEDRNIWTAICNTCIKRVNEAPATETPAQ